MVDPAVADVRSAGPLSDLGAGPASYPARWERTGEHRVPLPGEWYESDLDAGDPRLCQEFQLAYCAWILRALAAPAVAAPEVRMRPGLVIDNSDEPDLPPPAPAEEPWAWGVEWHEPNQGLKRVVCELRGGVEPYAAGCPTARIVPLYAHPAPPAPAADGDPSHQPLYDDYDPRDGVEPGMMAPLPDEPAAPPAPAAEPVALRPEVLAFAHAMEAQLRANDHKPGWKYEKPLDLLDRLHAEFQELQTECRRHQFREACSASVCKEAADVANFALMVADVCGGLDTYANQPAAPAGEDLDALVVGAARVRRAIANCEGAAGAERPDWKATNAALSLIAMDANCIKTLAKKYGNVEVAAHVDCILANVRAALAALGGEAKP